MDVDPVDKFSVGWLEIKKNKLILGFIKSDVYMLIY